MNVIRGIFELCDVERLDAGANRLRTFLLYAFLAVHQVRLHVRVCAQHQWPHYTVRNRGGGRICYRVVERRLPLVVG